MGGEKLLKLVEKCFMEEKGGSLKRGEGCVGSGELLAPQKGPIAAKGLQGGSSNILFGSLFGISSGCHSIVGTQRDSIANREIAGH